MQCGTARKQFFINPPPEVNSGVACEGEEFERAREHVSGCAACGEFFAAEERLKSLLQERAPREKASATLRERILRQLPQKAWEKGSLFQWLDFRPRSRRTLVWAGSLLLIVLMGGLWMYWRRNRVVPFPLTSVLVEDYVHNLPGVTEIASSDPQVVQSWFHGKVDFSFRLPSVQNPSLMGGRLCNLRGRNAALILYHHPQSVVSLFILDSSGVQFPEAPVVERKGRRCLVNSDKGYSLVLWKERGLLYGLVSDLRSDDLLQMAEQF